MGNSLAAARRLLESAAGKKLDRSARIEQAIQLAGLILSEANVEETWQEKAKESELARLLRDPKGKIFTIQLTDQAFRSSNPDRVASQILYLLDKYGVPEYLNWYQRLGLVVFKNFGTPFAKWLVPLIKKMIRQATNAVILPGEALALKKEIKEREAKGNRVNLNHLGEAILGEEEAEHRVQVYCSDLSQEEIGYISVKVSTLFSQINLLGWEQTLEHLRERLRRLLKASEKKFRLPSGEMVPRFVNLDMEEYRDLHLTVALFKSVLSEPEFKHAHCGIVLQSYLPDSYELLRDLTAYAIDRTAKGGTPIKIRIVKGANLAMERVEASIKDWPQAPYERKSEADANFKKMVEYSLDPLHLQSVKIGIASHNLFDIAYALLLRAEAGVEAAVTFEMLEGMANASRRVIQKLAEGMLIYCPAATDSEFQNAVAYLMRRLDENTGPENYLRASFGMKQGTHAWQHQADLFASSCEEASQVSMWPQRTQDRRQLEKPHTPAMPFKNEPDTDWSLEANRLFGQSVNMKWRQKTLEPIPLLIGHAEEVPKSIGIGRDPSRPEIALFQYAEASVTDIEKAIQIAEKAKTAWGACDVKERSQLLFAVAEELRAARGDLIGAMIANTAKSIPEADVEVSEAVDFAEYYRKSLAIVHEHSDLAITPKGVCLVASPWNFPCSIPAGGILAALAAGNAVLFKPAPEAVLVGYELVKLFWKAGIPKDVLQFVPCQDSTASHLVKDRRIDVIVLTGGTATAKLFLGMRPGLDLIAETGGKNSIIVTAMADRDLAVKDIVQSAFNYAGQKCSACSLAILEDEVFDDPVFKRQLKDAAASFTVGSAWSLSTKVNPLIREPEGVLKQAILHGAEHGEWLLRPEIDKNNPHLLTPGILWDVKPGGFLHMQELFGPILSVMRAKNLADACITANATPYGLTAGLQSLDEREHAYWLNTIEAGNCYINRGITGAIVERQPFGGTKASSFGLGAKAGGPNYVYQLMRVTQKTLPADRAALPASTQALIRFARSNLSEKDFNLCEVSLGSYSFYWKHYFSKAHEPVQLLGQTNLQRYVPRKDIELRITGKDKLVDLLRLLGAALIANAHLHVSFSEADPWGIAAWYPHMSIEGDEAFIERISKKGYNKVRLVSTPGERFKERLAELGVSALPVAVLANGRFELLQFLREISISYDYHRYGHLGAKELDPNE